MFNLLTIQPPSFYYVFTYHKMEIKLLWEICYSCLNTFVCLFVAMTHRSPVLIGQGLLFTCIAQIFEKKLIFHKNDNFSVFFNLFENFSQRCGGPLKK